MLEDAKTYLQNLSQGKAGETDLSNGKKDFINLALGINTKERSNVNPLYDLSARNLESFLTGRRVDRTSRATAPERSDKIPWSYEAYTRGKLNMTAGEAPEAQEPSMTGNQGAPEGAPEINTNAESTTEPNLTNNPQDEDTGTVSKQRSYLLGADTRSSAETFHQAIGEAASGHPAGKAVTIKPVEDYENSKLFLAPDKSAGAAVTPEGDLVSVFKKKGSSTDINDILSEAAPQAKTLDAYASGDGYLPNLYAKHDFRPVARVEFNREFAPENWPYDRFGEPDVVLMVRDPKGSTGLPKLNGDYMDHADKIPVVSYDEALKLQQDAVKQVDAANAEERAKTAGVSTAPLFKGDEKLPDLGEEPSASQIGRGLAARSRAIKRIPFDSRTPAAKEAISNSLTDEISHALEQHDNARGWYEHKVAEAKDNFAELHPEIKDDPAHGSLFNAMLAITSNGQKVLDNAYRAEELYRNWKETGRIESDSSWGGARSPAINKSLEMLQTLLDEKGLTGTSEFLNKKFTVGELKKLGFTVSGEAVDHTVRGAAIFGPKIGAGFFSNLQGD